MGSARWSPDRLDPECYPAPGVDLTVFYGDLDTQGHLNNVAFGRFFEQARFTAHRAVGMPAVSAAEGAYFLVARVSIDYLQEGRFGSDLHVRTRLAKVGSSSLLEEQAAWQGGACVALAEIVMVYSRDGASTPITAPMREVVDRLQPAVS
ncbi:MAG: acyl-CoA thioester hydrolase [Actinomycetota bacterium]|jgi:acyl-CoA thioester hydrolase|nr:acyl-CoA thioester hydrolase [Actinomycetota bacterium]